MPSPLMPAPGLGVPGLMLGLRLDGATYAALKGVERVHIGAFALGLDRAVDLELERFNVLAEDARLVIADGKVEGAVEAPDVVLLRGTIAGRPESSVFLGLSPHGTHGFVRTGGEREEMYIITTRPEGHVLGAAPTVVYNLTMLPEGVIDWVDFVCGVEEAQGKAGAEAESQRLAKGTMQSPLDGLPCRRVRVAVETDFEYYTRLGGNTAAAQAYISTLFGAMTEIYLREVNTRFEVGYTRLWSTPEDPFTSLNMSDRLSEFRALWNQSMMSTSRNIAHMLSGLRAGAGGVAYMGVLCGTSNSYAISGYINGAFPYPLVNNNEQNWDLMVAAHEIGHNFDAPHTHSMTPPVDGCGSGNCWQAAQGTIMSYCHTCSGGMTNISLDLHPRVIEEHIVPYLTVLSCPLGIFGPSIAEQPDPRVVHSGQPASFSVQATGTGPLSYAWRRDGADLQDGNGISGASTAMLSISSATAAVAGTYTVIVRNDCNEVESDGALLTVLAPCYANCDQSTSSPILNVDDFACFLGSFATAAALPAGQQRGHYANCDGSTSEPVLNVDDFACFINRFAQGCE